MICLAKTRQNHSFIHQIVIKNLLCVRYSTKCLQMKVKFSAFNTLRFLGGCDHWASISKAVVFSGDCICTNL